jgi:hypothetical protein
MTTFKGIRGTTIEVLSSDPSTPELGQIWYNSSSGTLKGYVLSNVNAWASSGNMNTARGRLASAGTQTAALGAGGYVPASSPTGATELFNGTSWTSSPSSLNTPRQYLNIGAVGTQTAATVFGGYVNPAPGFQNATENFNGTSWTNSGNLSTAKYGIGSAGIQTAALAFGGSNPGFSITTSTEKFNGTAWTSNPTGLNTARNYLAGCGTQTAALGISSSVESFNGSTWTNISSLNSPRVQLGAAGTQTSALAFGGNPPVASTELWNGTAWTSNPTGLGTARYGLGGAGTQTSAIAFGGRNPSFLSSTELWTGQALQTKTITVS